MYVQFRTDVPQLGTFWSAGKHTKEWTIEEKGSWFIVTNIASGKRHRIPLTEVQFVSEDGIEDAKNGKVKP